MQLKKVSAAILLTSKGSGPLMTSQTHIHFYKIGLQHWQLELLWTGTPTVFFIVSNNVHAKFGADTSNDIEPIEKWNIIFLIGNSDNCGA